MSESVDLSAALNPRLPTPGSLLPHAPPWLLVDRLISVDVDAGEVVADKLVTANDALCSDGFAETLVMEALAQTAACLNALKEPSSEVRHFGLLVQVKGFAFEGRAAVGDRIVLRCRQTAVFGALSRFSAAASVDDRVIAHGELTFALGAQS